MSGGIATNLIDDIEIGVDEAESRSPVSRSIDLEGAQLAALQMLIALGADVNDPTLRDTPRRMAKAYAELLTPRVFEMTTFPNDGNYDELVLATRIPFHSLCEHHLLPFVGTANVGYLPDQRILGISKLARVVEHFSRGLQVQERLTSQVANYIDDCLKPKGVGVVLSAEHTCMSLRGARCVGSTTVTSAVKGLLRSSERSRSEFFSLVDKHS